MCMCGCIYFFNIEHLIRSERSQCWKLDLHLHLRIVSTDFPNVSIWDWSMLLLYDLFRIYLFLVFRCLPFSKLIKEYLSIEFSVMNRLEVYPFCPRATGRALGLGVLGLSLQARTALSAYFSMSCKYDPLFCMNVVIRKRLGSTDLACFLAYKWFWCGGRRMKIMNDK